MSENDDADDDDDTAAAAGDLPVGPSSMRALMDFTTVVVRHVLASEGKERFLRNVRTRVCLRTR